MTGHMSEMIETLDTTVEICKEFLHRDMGYFQNLDQPMAGSFIPRIESSFRRLQLLSRRFAKLRAHCANTAKAVSLACVCILSACKITCCRADEIPLRPVQL
jgi:hypothetical protein